VEKQPRPRIVDGIVYRAKLTCGNLYVTISHKDHEIFEVFATLGKSGNCTHSMLEALTLSITMGIRHGVPVTPYIEKLTGVNCPGVSWDSGIKYLSCSDAIGQLLEVERKRLSALKEKEQQESTES